MFAATVLRTGQEQARQAWLIVRLTDTATYDLQGS